MTIRVARRMPWPLLLPLALLAVARDGRAACMESCGHQVTACKRTTCAGKRGADRRRCVADCVGGTGCEHRVGTLAYVVTACHEEGTSLVGSQELRILRDRCDPVVALRLENADPVADPVGLCGLLAKNHSGNLSPIAGVFQRLVVTPDGSGVIFEVTNQFQLIEKTALRDEQQGFFYVRADGTGLRRLAPPSRDPVYRLSAGLGHGGLVPGVSAAIIPTFGVSRDGTKVVYTDVGPGADGAEMQQVFTLDVHTSERRQLTTFPALPGARPIPRIWYPFFQTPDEIRFDRIVDADGQDWRFFRVKLDGTGLAEVGSSPSDPGGSTDGVVGRPTHTLQLTSGRVSVSEKLLREPSDHPDIFSGLPQFDLFAQIGKNLVQLTNFHLYDTALMSLRSLADMTARRAAAPDVMFMASADPLGTNPFENCNVFRISALGTHLRQLTNFSEGARSVAACGSGFFGDSPGCGIEFLDWRLRAASTVVFYSDCDPFGTNPAGSQAFLIDFAGHLRQLTHTAGARTAPDGTVDVEIPGPMARGGFAPS